MLQLFQWQNAIDIDKTPYDFIPDNGETNRPGQKTAPSGISKQDLRNGLENSVLPPLAIWEAGKWLEDLGTDNRSAIERMVEERDQHEAYVVTGAGTPGNWSARIYLLPEHQAKKPEPEHPLRWGKFWQEARKHPQVLGGGNSHYLNSLGTRSWGATAPAPPAPPKPPAPKPLPHNIRIRCVGCGHWWKVDDLPKHAENCCPGLNGGFSDWAIMCECCDTLDEVAQCLPGFPRPTEKKEVKKKDETKGKDEPAAEPAGE